jgi:hypothetical protein
VTSFATDIRPLFRDKDVQAMSFMLDLSSYEDVRANADGVLETVEDGSMPCDGAWEPAQVELLRTWIGEGFPE